MKTGKKAGLFVLAVCLMNLVASMAMLFVLGQATMAGGSPENRMTYIIANEPAVRIGWATWIGASLMLALFFYYMAEYLSDLRPQTRFIVRAALILAIIGAAADTVSDIISMGVLPDLAERFVHSEDSVIRKILLEEFRTWDHFSVLCTGGLANTTYGLAGCLVAFAMFQARAFPGYVRLLSIPLWAVTFFMSYGSVALDASILPVAVGSTMALFLVWTFLIGVHLLRSEE